MSRLLLENSNKAPELLLESSTTEWNTSISSVEWHTPKAGRELRFQFDTLTRLGNNNLPIRRLLFRKVIKGLDKKDFALIQAENRIKELQAQLDLHKPRKHRKVQTSPNSRFVDAKAIRQAQIKAGEIGVASIDSDSSTESESIGDCIEVEAL